MSIDQYLVCLMIAFVSMAAEAGLDSGHGLEGRRAMFLSVQGGGAQTDSSATRKKLVISYVIPVKHIGEHITNHITH